MEYLGLPLFVIRKQFAPAFTKCSKIQIIYILYSWQTSKKPEVVTKAQSNFLMQSCSNKDKVETSRHYLERYYEINILRLLKLDDIMFQIGILRTPCVKWLICFKLLGQVF